MINTSEASLKYSGSLYASSETLSSLSSMYRTFAITCVKNSILYPKSQYTTSVGISEEDCAPFFVRVPFVCSPNEQICQFFRRLEAQKPYKN
jgi:hypothetical protein